MAYSPLFSPFFYSVLFFFFARGSDKPGGRIQQDKALVALVS